jgi:hypothetical protein
MKNQYFGDINDYRKYGLLRMLQSSGGGRLLVAWMLTPDDGSRDGGTPLLPAGSRRLESIRSGALFRPCGSAASAIRSRGPQGRNLSVNSGRAIRAIIEW